MNKVTVNLISSAVNCRNEAIKIAGINPSKVTGIHTSYVEPVRPDGMGFNEFFALPRNCTITITFES